MHYFFYLHVYSLPELFSTQSDYSFISLLLLIKSRQILKHIYLECVGKLLVAQLQESSTPNKITS